MTRALPHANLNSSRLVRFLTDLAVSNTEPAQQQFAERLGRFLNFSDAITLSAALDEADKQHFDAHPASKDAIEEAFLQTRNTLVTAIIKSCAPNVEQARIKLPTIPMMGPFDQAAIFDRYHRFYATHQQSFDTCLRSLRAHIRNAIAGVSPTLKQLAVLDAAYDEILADRSRKLFSMIPKILEKRFDFLFKQHQETLAARHQEDDRNIWTQAGGWIERFNNELQGLLLAELDVRLQPALGLVEAFSKEVHKNQ